MKDVGHLQNFKFPTKKPVFGGTEMDLERMIEDDLIDLQIQMDTDNFGSAAMEAEAKKASKVASKKSSAK